VAFFISEGTTMPFNGNGVFSRIYTWVTDATNGVPMTPSRFDADSNDIAAGLSQCLTRNGQSTPTANLPMAGFKLTGLTPGITAGDSVSYDQLSAAGAVTTFLQSGPSAVQRTITDRGFDRVSAFDFMSTAQKTDVKNRSLTVGVSAAINAAIASRGQGCEIFLPDGDYLIDASITSGVKLKLAGGAMSETFGRAPSVRLVKASTLSGPAILLTAAASGSVLEGFELDGQAGNGGDGIVNQANSTTIRNVAVYRQGRDGIRHGMDGFGANANNWTEDRVVTTGNGRHGRFVNDKYDPTLSGAITAGTKTFTASGAFFTAAAVGYKFTIEGAGTGGTNLVTTITGFTSSTQVALNDAAVTTVSAAQFYANPDANAGVMINPSSNSNTADGYQFQNAKFNTVVGIHAETSTTGNGLHIGKCAQYNTFCGGDIGEGNGGGDLAMDSGSTNNVLYNVLYNTGTDVSGLNTIDNPLKSSTFVPVVTFGGASTGYVMTTFCEYVRRGNRVTGSLSVNITTKGSATGLMQITLPFASKNVNVPGRASLIYATNMTGLTGAISGYVAVNTNIINVQQTAATGLVDVTASNVAAGTGLALSFDYIVNG
jgi:hypothetical protein